MRSSRLGVWILMTCLAACGGSGGGGSSSSGSTGTTPPPPVAQANSMTVTLDAGPAALVSAGDVAANILYATVTICTPGSTTACQTVDHVQVDTGSTGLRILASALGSAVPATATEPNTGRPLLECVQFADGFSWGTVKTVDVTLGPRTIAALPINVIGDAAAGSAPASCQSGPAENDVFAFGANGVLGVGNFVQDCGQACAQSAVSGIYYTCASSVATSCAPTSVALNRQVSNPVSSMTADNNGVTLVLPAVGSPGAGTTNGTMLFGVGTQTDNALGAATVIKLSNVGTFTTVSSAVTYNGSFIDSGSNAYFFGSSIRTCPDATFFYCPIVAGTTTPTSLTLAGTITGTNAVTANVSYRVDNADQLFATNDVALPGLAGPNGFVVNGSASAFDWGLPFFFGRSVFVVIENNAVNGVTGPAVAF